MDEGSPVVIMYLDSQKDFDKVPHQRLLLGGSLKLEIGFEWHISRQICLLVCDLPTSLELVPLLFLFYRLVLYHNKEGSKKCGLHNRCLQG